MTTVIGIDPSLTGTGIAVLRTASVIEPSATCTIGSKGHRDDTFTARLQRLEQLTDQITEHAAGAELAVIEYPTLSQGRQGGHLDRHGLWWMILARLHDWEVPVAVVTASARACYATGRGNAAKDQVLAAVVRRYPTVDVQDNHQADALVLASIGARHLGVPVEESLPRTHLRALDKVAWPAGSKARA